MHLTVTNFDKMWPNFAKFSKNSLIMAYFALFTLILADICPKIAKFPPLCARMYKYNYIRPCITQILLRFFTFLKVIPISKMASLTNLCPRLKISYLSPSNILSYP